MRDRTFVPFLVLLAGAVFGGLVIYLQHQQQLALSAASDTSSLALADTTPRPIADTAKLVRDLKIITVELNTSVDSQRLEESWRGDVRATVKAPVRLLYGCDLSGVVADAAQTSVGGWLRPNLLTGGYTLRVPRPERIAAEIDGRAEQTDVHVGWARFRDLSGEYQLGLARSGLHEAARRLMPTLEQRGEIERLTTQQLTALLHALTGESRINIEFFDPPADGVAGAAEPAP